MNSYDHTLGVHAGRDDLRERASTPYQSIYRRPTPCRTWKPVTASLDALVAGRAKADNPVYARLLNPTVAVSRRPWPASNMPRRRSASPRAWRP